VQKETTTETKGEEKKKEDHYQLEREECDMKRHCLILREFWMGNEWL
jgi:hypothetical protein